MITASWALLFLVINIINTDHRRRHGRRDKSREKVERKSREEKSRGKKSRSKGCYGVHLLAMRYDFPLQPRNFFCPTLESSVASSPV
ncbi:hypothetical protein V8C37DRAFT_379190 [Trichoderma ceciliae]